MPISLPEFESVKKSIDGGSQEDYHLVQLYYSWYAGWFYRHRLKMATELLGKKFYNQILEIGIGSGIFIMELLKHANRVMGIDIRNTYHGVRTMLEKERVDLNRVELRQGDIFNIPYPNQFFDVVVCVSVLEHFPDPRPALSEIRRVIKPRLPIVLGFPAETVITRHIFSSLGYNAHEIHPAGHDKILAAIDEVLILDEIKVFPLARIPLYFACRAHAS